MLGAVHLSYNLGSAYDALRSEKLSDQFDRKLNLPRRTSFACRKASICDSTEGWRSNNIAWLTKVRMVSGPHSSAHPAVPMRERVSLAAMATIRYSRTSMVSSPMTYPQIAS